MTPRTTPRAAASSPASTAGEYRRAVIASPFARRGRYRFSRAESVVERVPAERGHGHPHLLVEPALIPAWGESGHKDRNAGDNPACDAGLNRIRLVMRVSTRW